MTSVLLFIYIILASLICVRGGTIAMELTGMDQERRASRLAKPLSATVISRL